MPFEDLERYLRSRVVRDDYRGIHLAQHNRLPEEKLVTILDAIHSAVGIGEFKIPPGDEPSPNRKHRPSARRQVNGFDDYYDILDAIANAGVKGVSATFNSLKKNHFPNFEVMGLLSRGQAGRIGRLTTRATKILDAGPTRKRTLLVGQAMERIFGSFANELHEILRNLDQLNVWEIMLIISDLSLSRQDKERFVRQYRRLRAIRRLELHENIQSLCDATMRLGKVEKRDWHNWWNEAKQIVTMLSLVPGFVVFQEEHVMLAGAPGIPIVEKARSAQVKREAMEWHGLTASTGWELHHVFPVEYAVGAADMALIDAKENLLYIPASRHREIPKRNNRSVKIQHDCRTLRLFNPANSSGQPRFDFEVGRDVRIRLDLIPKMIAYNDMLLRSIG
jgi:hypothetical protein